MWHLWKNIPVQVKIAEAPACERSSFCNTCGRSFRDKYTLRRHALSHSSLCFMDKRCPKPTEVMG
uniref:C2H2-type domain-containing protein n=1 Tax=Sparus aurata TaxID=8175 RepID=A0A671WYX9_SPAAU